MESIFDTIIDLNKSLNNVHSLPAIWITDKPIQTETERTVKIVKGHRIRLFNEKICDVSGSRPATHEVIECKGNISNTILYFELRDLISNENKILNVK